MSRGGRGSRGELRNILKTLRILANSAVGYNARQLQEPLRQQTLKTILGAGQVVRPFEENRGNDPTSASSRSASPFPTLPTDVIDRAKVVAAGVQTFVNLAAQGKFPGSGGFVAEDDRTSRRSNEAVDRSPRVYDTTGTPSPITGGLDLKEHPEEERAVSGSAARRDPFAEDQAAGPSIGVAGDPVVDRTSAILGSTPSDETHKHITKPMFSEGISPQEEAFLINAAKEVGVVFPSAGVAKQQLPKTTTKVERKAIVQEEHIYKPSLPKNYRVQLQEDRKRTLDDSRARNVPSSRLSRLANFGMLAVGLGTGAAAEVTRRSLGLTQKETSTADRVMGSSNPFLTPANAERIVQTLCRVRGAALKLGQMLSIQDESTVPSYLLQIFERVRHSADFMPTHQVHKQMAHELGDNWRDHFKEFEDKPFAAASIGQVHRGVTLDGRKVAVKVQYPGVAEGIDSDIDNLVSVLNMSGLFPKGMFLENFVPVARRELKMECDYRREARAMLKFRELLANDTAFYVPGVFPTLSSKRVLTAEYVEGKSVDLCVSEPQEVSDYVSAKFIELCLREIFVWRFMQTDPNWSNFFLGEHPMTGEPRLILLDFGASRAYPKLFVDRYMKIIRAAYDLDKEGILKHSKEIGFLTGYESKQMQQAHCNSIMILAETLASDHPYDFGEQNITRRIHEQIPVMLEHRLTAPPEEIYSLHRKLSGSYLLATKLKAVVSCGPLFHEISHNYKFGEDGRDIDIDSEPSDGAKVSSKKATATA